MTLINRVFRDQVVNDSKIILIFEGIDGFIDSTTMSPAPVYMWLPMLFIHHNLPMNGFNVLRVLPERIKVIVSTNSSSQAC